MTTHAEVKELADRAMATGRQFVVTMGGTIEPEMMQIARRIVIESIGGMNAGMCAFLDLWSCTHDGDARRDIVSDALPHDCEEVIDLVLAELDELHGGGRAERAFKATAKTPDGHRRGY